MLIHWCARDDRALKSAIELCERTGMKSNRMRSFLTNGIARLAVARDGAQVKGFATVIQRPAEHFARVDYMATAPEARRSGVGTALLEFVRDETGRSFDQPGARYDMVLLETQPDQVGFFGRRGARQVGVQYQFPAEPPVPLALMAIPVRPSADVPRPYMERVLRALFEIEGRPPGDPLLAKLIAGLPQRAPLEVPRAVAVRTARPIEREGVCFTLRGYRPSDYDAVRMNDADAALYEVAALDDDAKRAYRDAWLRSREADFRDCPGGKEPGAGATVLVLVDDAGGYAGHIWWEEFPDPVTGTRVLWVQSIAVAAARRNQGWGGALLDEALAEARALRIPRVSLSVHAVNAAARALYDSRGFSAVRVTMDRDVDLK